MEELFNLESVYDEQISPLMKQIIAICHQHQMPMICSFVYDNDAEKGVGACTTVLNGFEGRFHEEYRQAQRIVHGSGGHFAAFAIKTVVNKGGE